VCFLGRAGEALSSVRLVGVRTDELWQPRTSEASDGDDVQVQARTAAAWIGERAGAVGLLCVDVDGSNCSWLTLSGADPAVVAATLGGREDDGSDWRAPDAGGASIQALAAAGSTRTRRLPAGPTKNGSKRAVRHVDFAGHRMAVLAVPDALARIVIDELDDRGVNVENASSLWHAMTLAWDPASPMLAGAGDDGRVVGVEAPVTGIVLVDPAGRLVWAWSRAGALLAGGVVMTSTTAEGGARVGRAAVARLLADWLGWSVQLGVTPSRLVCVAPPADDATEAEDSLGPAEIGASLGRGWAGATVDMAVVEDPLGATLQRLAGMDDRPLDDARSSLTGLNRRPRRIHRSMYLWGALAVVLLAAGLLGVGFKAWRNAGEALARGKTVRDETREAVLQGVPPPANDDVARAIAESNPRQYIEDRIQTHMASRSVNTGLPPVRPILSELESLSFVLLNDDIELEEIQLGDSLIHVYVYVPATRVAEEIKESLESIAGDHCDWKLSYTTTRKNDLQLVHLDGSWKVRSGAPANAGTSP
jgi:hypothetical protein